MFLHAVVKVASAIGGAPGLAAWEAVWEKKAVTRKGSQVLYWFNINVSMYQCINVSQKGAALAFITISLCFMLS